VNTRGDTPVVVFDGICVLCCAGLQWIVRHDRRGHWRFLTMQSRRGAAALIEAGIKPLAPVSFLVLYGSRSYIESEACLVIARDVGGIWKVLAMAAQIVPRSVRDAAYRVVARNRYRWFGRRASCYAPSADEGHRLLAD
jgi:predicted DCC family thiol-disulfide oxidoreductase YuxK